VAEEMIDLPDEDAMLKLGAALASHVRIGDVIALEGGLGAGKTTLTRGILEALGLEGEAPSPSFALVQPYDIPEVRLPVTHIDLYRIDDPAEIAELGLDDYLTDSLLVIEWPERLGNALWSHALRLHIDIAPGGGRRLTARLSEDWKERWSKI